MWILMATMIQNWMTKAYRYVMIAGAVVASLLLLYFKGRSDKENEIKQDVLERELENRNVAEGVRRGVDGEPNPTERLRREWSREGS